MSDAPAFNVSLGYGTTNYGGWGSAAPAVVQYVAPAQIQSSARPVIGGNASPIGRPIPTGLGMVVHTGDPVIDPAHLGGYRVSGTKVLVNLVYCLLDTQIGGVFDLIWVRANKSFIVRNEAPTRSMASPYRFYGGSQTAVDPLITQYLDAQYRTAWPGFVYVVFEDFDIAPYNNRVPVFDFQIASTVTTQPANQGLSTVTFQEWATYDPNYGNSFYKAEDKGAAFDFAKGRFYQMVHPRLPVGPPNLGWVVTVAISTNAEISRSPLFDDTGADYRRFEWPMALQNSDFFVVCNDDRTGIPEYETPLKLLLVNGMTGEIVSRLDTGVSFASWHPEFVLATARLTSTTYLVFVEGWPESPMAQSAMGIAMVNTTTGAMSWIAHPISNPIGGVASRVFSIAVGPGEGTGTVVVFWNEQDRTTYGIGDFRSTVRKAVITASGFTESVTYTEAVSGKYPQGVAFDSTDGWLVIYREDGSCKKITSAGAVVYETAATAFTGLLLNTGSTGNLPWALSYRARPGIAYASDEGAVSGFGDICRIDLSDGSISSYIVLDGDITGGGFSHRYLDDYGGWYANPWSYAGQILKLGFGDLTPGTIDLADIMLALGTFDGRHDSGDLDFTGFPGNECYGVKYETDTSIQDALRALREPFDISIVESDGKLKFRWPPRDGTFAADLTLSTKSKFVDKGQYSFEKVSSAEQESLRECEISFFDRDNYGERGTPARFARPKGAYDITHSIDRRSLNLPLYMTASRALQQAALVVYRSVYALEKYQGSLGPELAYLEPGDIIQFPFESDTTSFDIVAQIKDAQLNANYTQDVALVQYLQAHDATYTGAQIAVPPITSTPFVSSLSAVAGSYIITGSEAGVVKSIPRLIFAHGGIYAITGTSATLINTSNFKELSAGPGTYAFTGTEASLANTTPRIFSADAGSYAFTGTDATLMATVNKRLDASPGSYAITGTNASLKQGWKLGAGLGAYAFTGTNATPTYRRKIAAGAGSYAFTGTDATVSPSDANFASVVVLVGGSGADASTSFTDESSYARTLTANGNIQNDTGIPIYGKTSILCDGAGDFLTAADAAALELGSGDWTIETTVQYSTISNGDAGDCIAAKYNATGNQRSWYFKRHHLTSVQELRFVWSTDGINDNIAGAGTTWAPTSGSPNIYHLAAVRSGSNVLVFVNGTLLHTTAISGTIFNSTEGLRVGAINSVAGFRASMHGTMQEFRMTVGVARYTANFTPPVTSFPRS